jgi:hypothetical protein
MRLDARSGGAWTIQPMRRANMAEVGAPPTDDGGRGCAQVRRTGKAWVVLRASAAMAGQA